MDVLECRKVICERFLSEEGLRPSAILAVIGGAQHNVNNDCVELVSSFMSSTTGMSLEAAINVLWPAISKMDVLPVVAALTPVSVVPKPALLVLEQEDMATGSGVIDLAGNYWEEVQREGGLAFYPERLPPPENIDLHLDMTLKTGLFRLTAKGAVQQELNSRRVFRLSTPLDSGYEYMSLSGPVLNAQLDLLVYVCLTHWFGRLSKSQFELAIHKPNTMSLSKFFSPIPSELQPGAEATPHLLGSFQRLKSVVLSFFKKPDAMAARTSVMVANLAGTLTLNADRTITLSPTPELRVLYLNTKKLVPLNRSAVIKLGSQMARLLALYIAAKSGRLSGRQVYLRPSPITALDLLKEIHPKVSYSNSDRRLLTAALNELMESGLVDADIEYRNVKSNNGLLTMSTVITFKSHRLGDASDVKMVSVSEMSTKVKAPAAVKTPMQLLFARLSFPRARFSSRTSSRADWCLQNKALLDSIVSSLRSAAQESIQHARMQLVGIPKLKVLSLVNILVLTGQQNDSELVSTIIATNPCPREGKSQELDSMIRAIPLPAKCASLAAWHKAYAKDIKAIKTKLLSLPDQLGEAARINYRVYFSRLVTPLLALEKQNDADFFKGMWEAGREAESEERINKWNARRR